MQPYFFPYIGYFQLMSVTDVFVLYDDVQYTDQRWINRNRILLNERAHWLTLPVRRSSHLLPINAREYVGDHRIRRRLLTTVRHAYVNSPQFPLTFPFIESLILFEHTNVAYFNEHALRELARLLALRCTITSSSTLRVDPTMTGQARVLEICRRLSATEYVNPIGGVDLYDSAAFANAGLRLSFVRPIETRYLQFGDAWVPFLSVIDVLMFNDHAARKHLLSRHELLEQSDARSLCETPDSSLTAS